MTVEITDDEAVAFVQYFGDDGAWADDPVDVRLPRFKMLKACAKRLGPQVAKPLEVGDIVHLVSGMSNHSACMRVLCIAVDAAGDPMAWVRDGENNLRVYRMSNLDRGERP